MSTMLVVGAARRREENFGAERRPVRGEEADLACQTSPLAIVTAQGRPPVLPRALHAQLHWAAQPQPASRSASGTMIRSRELIAPGRMSAQSGDPTA